MSIHRSIVSGGTLLVCDQCDKFDRWVPSPTAADRLAREHAKTHEVRGVKSDQTAHSVRVSGVIHERMEAPQRVLETPHLGLDPHHLCERKC